MGNTSKKKANKTNARISIIASCVLIACCVGFFGYNAWKGKQTRDIIDGAKNSSTVSLDVESDESSDARDTNVIVASPIDFESLQATNEDLYAWIYIPNTSVDYPVAQSGENEDNSFYLHHGIDKGYYFAGTVYTEKENSRLFTDRNTVLYGHNMLDGSMFTTIHKFENKEFFDDNEYIYIYTPGHVLTYRIFAAYETDDRHILRSYNFDDDSVWADYVAQVSAPESAYVSNYRDVDLTTNDTIITLSTCTDYRPSNRFLVQAKLEKDNPTT